MGTNSAQFFIWKRAKLVDIFVGDDKDVSIVARDFEHAILEKPSFELLSVRHKLGHAYLLLAIAYLGVTFGDLGECSIGKAKAYQKFGLPRRAETNEGRFEGL